ncbi:HtaA domain-containing protein [Streptomyces sp. NPDC090499]|uniref:HtaA domain-containing protein n=1 Tax=Streptomyces sp. NPDC090499 TaxID=3365965 RepID=UPI003800DFFA
MRKHLHRLVVDLRQQPLLEHLGGRAVGGDTGAFTASFAGCNFVGHREANGAYRLDLTFSRPTVRISGPAGTLYLDVTSKAKGTGTVTTSTQVPFASLALGGVGMKGAGTPTATASDTTGAASGGVASTTGGTGGTGDALAATGSALPATALGAAAAVTAAAGAGVVYAMRRRRTEG